MLTAKDIICTVLAGTPLRFYVSGQEAVAGYVPLTVSCLSV